MYFQNNTFLSLQPSFSQKICFSFKLESNPTTHKSPKFSTQIFCAKFFEIWFLILTTALILGAPPVWAAYGGRGYPFHAIEPIYICTTNTSLGKHIVAVVRFLSGMSPKIAKKWLIFIINNPV